MYKAYKYRLYPNAAQQKQIDETINICRYVYNIALETKIRAWQSARINLSAYDLSKQLTDAKNDFPWLRNAASNALDAVLSNLDKAYTRFFKGAGFPKFKSKRGHQSFQSKNGTRKIDFDKSLLSVCKIKNIPIVISRRFDGQIRTVTISRTTTGKYFTSILVKADEQPMPASSFQKAVGIDLGLNSYAVLSNGEKIDNPKYLRRSLDRLRILSRRVSAKKKRSKNQQKAFKKIALLHEKIANQRNDFLHKVSSKIIGDNQADIICLEGFAVGNLVTNRSLSKSISDASWASFVQMLEYKAKWSGKGIVRINRFFPSSKICSNCNYQLDELPLSVREWVCPTCGVVHDRDINAAINIRNQGLIISRRGTSVEPVELLSLEGTLKQEQLLQADANPTNNSFDFIKQNPHNGPDTRRTK